ncbi:MAG TPA: hypothetical protein VM554_03520 [Acidisarcina sp.]|nr:hypothetical protein [Acidisarcina sp.]
MSLVISAWDKHTGVAVCEGRVGKWADGKYVPTEENYSKLTRLPNGGILGIAGHSREGFSTYASLTDVLAKQLRPAIVQAAETRGFCELSELIPELLADCNRAHPELFFCVSLLGTDSGTVRGGAWDSDGKASVPTETDGAWLILGPSAEMDAAVSTAVGGCLGAIGLQDADTTSKALECLIRGFAAHCPDINDHTFSEIISSSPRECMNANNITTGTLAASRVQFPDGSALTTAGVQTFSASASTSALLSQSGFATIPGLSISVTAASTSDVFNVSASLILTATAYATAEIRVMADSTSRFDVTYTVPSATGYIVIPVLCSITGLSAGTHTISMAAYAPNGVDIGFGSQMQVQRIF